MKKFGLSMILGLALVGSALANNGNKTTADSEKMENTAAVTYSLQGTIYDPVCQEALSGATITINGKKYYSDLSGNFEIPFLAKGKHSVSIDFVSYQQQTMEIDLDKNQKLEIQLKQQ